METNGGPDLDTNAADGAHDPQAQLDLIDEAEAHYYDFTLRNWKVMVGLDGPWTLGRLLALWGLVLVMLGCGVYSVWRQTSVTGEGSDWPSLLVLPVLFAAAIGVDRLRGRVIGVRPHAFPPAGARVPMLKAMIPVMLGVVIIVPLMLAAADAGNLPLALAISFGGGVVTIGLTAWWARRFGPGARRR
ncbi:MAG: hypothetical protein AAGA59_04815 [Actinomycetota bacterium]